MSERCLLCQAVDGHVKGCNGTSRMLTMGATSVDLRIERIECAAIRHDESGLIFSLPRPARHHDILHKMFGLGLSTTRAVTTQGFLTTDGEFAWRTKARSIAVFANQLLPRAGDSDELFSEDVW